MSYDVFLSYSRNDLEAATVLLGQLKKAGWECFAQGALAGRAMAGWLQEAVEACGAFVALGGASPR